MRKDDAPSKLGQNQSISAKLRTNDFLLYHKQDIKKRDLDIFSISSLDVPARQAIPCRPRYGTALLRLLALIGWWRLVHNFISENICPKSTVGRRKSREANDNDASSRQPSTPNNKVGGNKSRCVPTTTPSPARRSTLERYTYTIRSSPKSMTQRDGSRVDEGRIHVAVARVGRLKEHTASAREGIHFKLYRKADSFTFAG
jgi:hypothetical protein